MYKGCLHTEIINYCLTDVALFLWVEVLKKVSTLLGSISYLFLPFS